MSFAYLDAGTGGLIASVLVGGTAAAGVAVRSARSRVTGAFSRKPKDDGLDRDSGDPAPTAGDDPSDPAPSGA